MRTIPRGSQFTVTFRPHPKLPGRFIGNLPTGQHCITQVGQIVPVNRPTLIAIVKPARSGTAGSRKQRGTYYQVAPVQTTSSSKGTSHEIHSA